MDQHNARRGPSPPSPPTDDNQPRDLDDTDDQGHHDSHPWRSGSSHNQRRSVHLRLGPPSPPGQGGVTRASRERELLPPAASGVVAVAQMQELQSLASDGVEPFNEEILGEDIGPCIFPMQLTSEPVSCGEDE